MQIALVKEIEKNLQKVAKDVVGKNVAIDVEIPTLKEHGDYSTNVAMKLAKEMKKKPSEIAKTLVDKLEKMDYIEKIEVVQPGFINFYVDYNKFTETILTSIYEDKLFPKLKTDDKVIVEHTSVNPNKSMHVGHIRNAVLGDSISRLLKKLGYEVEVQNYIDDTGLQVADTLNGILNLDVPEVKGQKFDDYCWDVYTAINKEYETNKKLQEKRKGLLHEIEKGNGELAEKSKEIVDKILSCHLDVMNEFGIFYDLLTYESDIIGFGFWDIAFEELKKSPNFVFVKKGENKGCWVLKYDDKRFGDKIFVRSDGTKVYTAKDTAYHLWKFGLLKKDFLYKKWPNSKSTWRTHPKGEKSDKFGNAQRIITVIDERQTYPQEMVKHAFDTLGYKEQASKYLHVAYGVVSLTKETAESLGVEVSGEKRAYAMSGRQGIGVKVTDLLKALEKKVAKVQAESEVSDGEVTSAKNIALGAIKHYMLKNNPKSEVLFDLDQALQLVGNTGPYLQYSHARASSILKKAGEFTNSYDKTEDLTETERDLISKLSEFPSVVENTLEDFNMSLIANYTFNLSKTFHSFYEQNNVMKSKDAVKAFRLTLAKAYTMVNNDLLNILGIVAPEKM